MAKYVSFRIERIKNEDMEQTIRYNIGYQDGYLLYQTKWVYKGGDRQRRKIIDKLELWDIIAEQETRSKRKIQTNTDRFFLGKLTFSNTMDNDYKSNPKLFYKQTVKFLKKLSNLYYMTPLIAKVILDKSNPFVVVIFDNIDHTGKAVKRTINPKILTECQTLMGEYYEPMGYQRGKNKADTKTVNLSNFDYRVINDFVEHFYFTKLDKERLISWLRGNIEEFINEESQLSQFYERVLSKYLDFRRNYIYWKKSGLKPHKTLKYGEYEQLEKMV